MNYKLLLLIFATVGFVLFSVSSNHDAYAFKISCAAYIDVQEYPICNHVTDWNESEEFNDKVLTELANDVEEIKNNPGKASQIHQQVIDKVSKDNPGLQEKCKLIKDWIYELIHTK